MAARGSLIMYFVLQDYSCFFCCQLLNFLTSLLLFHIKTAKPLESNLTINLPQGGWNFEPPLKKLHSRTDASHIRSALSVGMTSNIEIVVEF